MAAAQPARFEEGQVDWREAANEYSAIESLIIFDN
jgi:hypothetical protein